MTSAMMNDRVQRRVNEFRQRCGDYGETALHLAYHAALPVALNAELLHLFRINFFLDPPEVLPYTAEFEFLLSPLCREIDQGLYEIEPEIRDVLLAGLAQTYDVQRIRDLATLLWQYVEHHSPWSDRVELERAQQLTALNFLDSEKAQQWLASVEREVSQDGVATREWFVAMRQQIENRVQFRQAEEILADLLVAISARNRNIRRSAAEALGKIESEAAISALISALQDENDTVRSSAAESLGNLRAETALPALIRALQDQNSNVRSSAVVALDKIKPEVVIPELIDALGDENYPIRSIAAEALGNIGSEIAVPALVNALQDQYSSVRLKAVEALDKIRSEAAIPALREATHDSNADVRRVAAEVLARIDHHANDDLLENVPNQNSIALLRSSSTSEVWTLEGGVFRIGRGENNNLIIQKPAVSRQHAEISYRYLSDDAAQPTYFLRDFSRYGTWTLTQETEEWQRIHRHEVMLPSGTQLKFGDIHSPALEFSITPVETLEPVESSSERQSDQYKAFVDEVVAEIRSYGLTDRETEVWLLRKAGYTYKAIASQLHIVEDTVKKYIKSIYAKRDKVQIEVPEPTESRLEQQSDQYKAFIDEAVAEIRGYGLTDRETEVWLLRKAGYTYKAIASQLCLSEDTVKKHVKSISAKRSSIQVDVGGKNN